MKMPFTESNFSFIVCVLYWRLLSHPEVGAVTTTTSFPIASLNITPSDTVTVEGRDTQLNCSFHHVGSNVPAWKIYDGVRYIEVTSGATLHRDGYNATLDASSGEYHLIMRNATLALAGNYECSLLGSNIYHRAELVVLEYGPVCGVSPGHTVVSNQSESTFTCHVDGGSWGDLVWLKNGVEISRVSTSTNEYSTILQKTDNGAVYNCRYESQNISSHLWPQLTCIDDISVDVQYKPSIKDKDKETINVTKESSVSLFCSADANPNAKITWKKEGNDLGAIGDNGIYIISSVVEDDQGMYTCTAENYLGDDQREINLHVILSSWYSVVVPVVSTLSVIMLLAVLVVVIVAVWRKRKRKLVRDRKVEGETDHHYQELELRDLPQPPVYTTIEQYAFMSNGNSDTNTEYAMPGEIVLEFPKEYVRQKDLIGEGTFGRVFKAEAWELCGRDGVTVVALKTIKDNATEDDKQKLTDEFELLKTIGRNKNILSLIGCCTKTEPVYLLLDYMALGNLQKYLRDFRKSHTDNYANAEGKSPSLSSGDLISFARQTGNAMAYLTSKKVIHGNLAARNVMLNDDKICKVTNFGRDLENLSSDAEDNKTLLPVRWVAPEALWSSEFSIESDVWSFGVVVWEIVTLGNTPYPGMSAKEVIEYLKQGSRLSRPKHCKEDLYLLMMKCWSQKPSRRPKFKDLVHELEEIERDTQVYVDVNSAIDDVQEDANTTE